MLVWTPDATAAWFTAAEDATNVNQLISITSSDATVISINYTLSPNTLPAGAQIVKTANSIALVASSLSGILPITRIRYLRGGVPGTCQTWETLPSDAEDVLEYVKDPSSPKTFTLSVTAVESPLSPTTSGTQTKNYQFKVEGNYSSGRDRLRSEINARRK